MFDAILFYFENYIMGGAVIILLLGVGVYLTISTRFFVLRGFPFIVKNTIGTLLKKDETPQKKGNITPFGAMTTALAGTMGVGNIAGVATALVAGGPGSIFWMWVSAFFGMSLKYSEIYLAVAFRGRDKNGAYYGGPMYYMEKGMGSKKLATLFAVLCAVSSFGIGNATQINSLAMAMEGAFSVPSWFSGGFVAVVVALVVFGGVQRISKFTQAVIPFISIIYICISGVFLFSNRLAIPGALSLIFNSAFSSGSALGGIAGYSVATAMRMGLSRGLFTNEAGLGSAPIAHACADCKSPQHQGAWGVFEVFLDTMVVCTITAVVLLTAGGGELWRSGLDGAALTSAAFESQFAGFGGKFIAVSIVFFAISAMLGWCFYGESALAYIAGKNKITTFMYRLIFIVVILLGASSSLKAVWAITDLLNIAMILPNAIALVMLAKIIKTI